MPRLPLVRLLAGAIGAVVVAAGLTGCATGSAASGCTSQVSSGSASDSVVARSALGVAPTISFDSPLHVQSTQEIVAEITILNASTGAVVTKTAYTGNSTANAFVVKNIPVIGLRQALVCAQVGDRIAAVIPPAEGIPNASRPSTLGADDDVVIVVDVLKAYLARANGTPQVMGTGLPAVVLGADGRPGITLPAGTPPTDLTVAELRSGSGAVVRSGQTAVVQYTGVLWKPGSTQNGTVFDSSWKDGSPVSLPLKTSSVIRGLVTALAGKRVGSQVLVVIPPRLAYGSQSSTTVPAGSTLVFVVDILGKA